MSAAHQIPTRSEIPERDTWDLTQIFKTEEEYRTSFFDLRESYSKVAEFKGHLGESADTLLACLEFDKRLEQSSERLGHYSSLKKSEDSSDDVNLSRRAELTNLLTKVHEASSYITPEIQAIQTKQRFHQFANPFMRLDSPKQEAFAHALKAWVPEIELALQQAPPFDPNWEQIAHDQFQHLFQIKIQKQTTVPGLSLAPIGSGELRA